MKMMRAEQMCIRDRYYRTLEQAYEQFGFEEDVLKQALKNSIEEVQHGISE